MQYTRLDFTFDNVSIAYLTCIEVNAAIACACCMTIKPLMMRVFPMLWGSRSGSADVRDIEAAAGSGGNRRPPTIGSKPSRVSAIEKRRNSWFGHMFHQRSNSNLQLLEEDDDEVGASGKRSTKESEAGSHSVASRMENNQMILAGNPEVGRGVDGYSGYRL